jgi:predicted RNase H-like HicB family nuclease/DNA-binding XRE family transcriptional regulator
VQYDAFIHREGSRWLAEFPDCPGCQTFATAQEIAAMAQEALEGWLEAHLAGGKVPRRPTECARAPEGKKLVHVPVRAGLAAVLAIRWARQDAGLSQAELGRRAGVSQQQINKLEDPDENPKIETLERVAHALGLALDVNLIDAPRIALAPARRHAR